MKFNDLIHRLSGTSSYLDEFLFFIFHGQLKVKVFIRRRNYENFNYGFDKNNERLVLK